MKVGVRIKGDEIIVLKHNDDIIEENVESIVIIFSSKKTHRLAYGDELLADNLL